MRQILFRGKRVDKGEWVGNTKHITLGKAESLIAEYGLHVNKSNTNGCTWHFMPHRDVMLSTGYYFRISGYYFFMVKWGEWYHINKQTFDKLNEKYCKEN